MTDETIEQAAIDQRATDPRLETPVVDPPIVQDDPVIDQDDQDGTPEPVLEPEVPVKVKKTAEDVLKGRVGHLTKTLSAKDVELQAALNRAAAAEALVLANNPPVSGESIQGNVNTPPATTYAPADFEAAVAARVEAQEFNRKADEMYNVGATKYDDWKDSVDTLVASGFMDKTLLDAAMAVEDGPAVLYHLGTNLDEAERINALTPIRKAAEMAKLSNQLSIPKNVPVSSAPAPIRPVSGSPSPQVDLQRISEDNDMRAYAAARQKQGSRWAQGRGK